MREDKGKKVWLRKLAQGLYTQLVGNIEQMTDVCTRNSSLPQHYCCCGGQNPSESSQLL